MRTIRKDVGEDLAIATQDVVEYYDELVKWVSEKYGSEDYKQEAGLAYDLESHLTDIENAVSDVKKLADALVSEVRDMLAASKRHAAELESEMGNSDLL